MSSTTAQPNAVGNQFLDALERVRPELARMGTAGLRSITLNPVAAAVTVRGALPKILALRSQLLLVPGFEHRSLDELEVFLHAWLRANALFLAATPSAQEFSSGLARVTYFRDRFVSDTAALVQRGRLPVGAIEQLRGAVGYRRLAADVLTLTTLFRSRWAEIAGHSCIARDELDAADSAVDAFITLLGLRARRSAGRQAADLVRRQTYTLFVQAYDEVRRAVLLVRFHQRDGDAIAPSLFAPRHRRMGVHAERETILDEPSEQGDPALVPAAPPPG